MLNCLLTRIQMVVKARGSEQTEAMAVGEDVPIPHSPRREPQERCKSLGSRQLMAQLNYNSGPCHRGYLNLEADLLFRDRGGTS